MLGFNTTIQQRALRIMEKADLVVLDWRLIASIIYGLMDRVLFIRVE
jgi:hypothetical protein